MNPPLSRRNFACQEIAHSGQSGCFHPTSVHPCESYRGPSLVLPARGRNVRPDLARRAETVGRGGPTGQNVPRLARRDGRLGFDCFPGSAARGCRAPATTFPASPSAGYHRRANGSGGSALPSTAAAPQWSPSRYQSLDLAGGCGNRCGRIGVCRGVVGPRQVRQR